MAIGIIELNDAGVRVGRGGQNAAGGDEYLESPGVAVVNRKELLLGEAALRQSRLQPLETNSLFWHRLSTEPLAFQNNQYRHHADLAYSHLLSLHQNIADCDQVIFALPGSFTRQQMSLLLGIVGQCPFDAAGLVDCAVAASAPYARADTLVHVDLQLHQCVFTQMRADEQLRCTRIDVLPHCGLLTLRDHWAKAIADQFIDQSRFDPLHSAVTEQSLYDQLPAWLDECHRGGELFIEVAGKNIKLTREQVLDAVRGTYGQIITRAGQLADPRGQLLLGDRLAALPGLVEAFADNRSEPVEPLPKSAVMEGIHRHLDAIQTGAEQISFVQALPLAGGKRRSAQAHAARSVAGERRDRDRDRDREREQKRRSPQVTAHLLIGDTAYPLAETVYVDLDRGRLAPGPNALSTHCGIHRRGDTVTLIPHNGAAVTINAGRADETTTRDNHPLRPGDRVSLQGRTSPAAVLIDVVAQ